MLIIENDSNIEYCTRIVDYGNRIENERQANRKMLSQSPLPAGLFAPIATLTSPPS